MGRSCSNVVSRTVFTHGEQYEVKMRLANIRDGGGRHLEKNKEIITLRIHWPFLFTFYRRSVLTHGNRT